MLEVFTKLLSRSIAFPHRVLMHAYLVWLATRANIELGSRIKVDGLPLIDIKKGARLCIADNVTLTSRNRGYHINLHSPVKLFADRDGARIRIGENTRIHGACIHAWRSIDIGRNCLIAANCHIFDANGHDLSFENVAYRINTKGEAKPIVIQDNVWVCANSVILPGVTIGEGSVISINSVVRSDIPARSLVMGNPAVVVRDFLQDS